MYLKGKKNSKHNSSCLQDEACLCIKTESPNANYDTSMHMFERFQKSSDNLPAPSPTSPLRRTVFTQRLVSGHVYEVNMAPRSQFLLIRKSKYWRDIASKMKYLCYLIRSSNSSRGFGGTD